MAKRRKVTGKELIEKLSKDWLERDGESFVKIRTKGRLGWEESLREGTPYSSYLLDSPSMDELIKRAYALARNTISAMDIPSKVTVRLGGGGSCTEGRNVTLRPTTSMTMLWLLGRSWISSSGSQPTREATCCTRSSL